MLVIGRIPGRFLPVACVGDASKAYGGGYRVMVIVVVFGGQRIEFLLRGIDAGAPEVESPVDERAVVFVDFGVFDYDGPFA